MTTTGLLRGISAVSLALLVATAAVGQTTSENDSANSNDWEFKLAPLYIWFAGIEGDAGLGPVSAPVNITFSDVLENLSGIFTLHFEARKSKWNIFADGMHLEISPSATLPNGAPVNITVKNNIVEIGGTYRVRDEAPSVELLVGARYTHLNVSGSPVPLSDITEEWWDGFGGVRLAHEFGDKKDWTISGRADVGAGGSDLTWSAIALVGWQFNKWGSLNAGYKWLAYDYETGSGLSRFSWDVTYEGPIAGLVINW